MRNGAMDRRPREILSHAVLWQNISLALGIKAVFLALAIFGDATMWMAVFADMGAMSDGRFQWPETFKSPALKMGHSAKHQLCLPTLLIDFRPCVAWLPFSCWSLCHCSSLGLQ
jgi:hypothetical protein